MESTAADAMPDDTDLTPQAPEPEQPPEETSGDTSAEPASATSAEPAAAEANLVMGWPSRICRNAAMPWKRKSTASAPASSNSRPN